MLSDQLKCALLGGAMMSSLLAPCSGAVWAQEEEEDGVLLEAAYTAEVWHVPEGGLSDDLTYIDNFDLSLTAPVGRGTLFAYGIYNNRGTLTGNLIDDAQVVSNIDNDEMIRLFEFWYEYPLFGDKATVKAGLLDLNSEFDVIETAGLFINSSHGIGPEYSQTGLNGPSIFPTSAFGIRYIHEVSEGVDIRGGVYDAVPNDPDEADIHRFSLDDGALFVLEANRYFDNGLRLGVGGFAYSSKFDSLIDPDVRRGGNAGLYGIAEMVFSDSYAGWVRAGFVNRPDLNEISSYLGGGFVKTGIFGRDDDQIGFAVAQARVGRAVPDGGHETSLEVTWSITANDWFRVQPNVQYIINPGYDRSAPNALALGLRFEFAFDTAL